MAEGTRRQHKPVLRRRRDGVTEFRCTRCEEWKPESDFARPPTSKRGEHYSRCNECRNAERRERYRADPERYRIKERARGKSQTAMLVAANEADRRLKDRLNKSRGKRVPNRLIRPWIDRLLAEADGTMEGVAMLVGVPSRRIWNIRTDGDSTVSTFDTAEKVARALGQEAEDELWEEVGEPGYDGWGVDRQRRPIARFCGRCGSWERPHYAKGFCRRCYRAVTRAHKLGLPLAASPEERWALRHTACLECRRTDSPHRGRGLCQRCYQRWQVEADKHGVKISVLLDRLYPMDFPQAQRAHRFSPVGRRSKRSSDSP